MSVDSIGVVSAEVASGSQDLSARTEQAAASLQQTASLIEQISSTVRQSAKSAHVAKEFAQRASEVAAQGGEAVGSVVRVARWDRVVQAGANAMSRAHPQALARLPIASAVSKGANLYPASRSAGRFLPETTVRRHRRQWS